MKKVHEIKNLSFNNGSMYVVIDGKFYTFDLKKISKRLLKAPLSQRGKFEVSPSGYGIHWPSLDEDLSVDGLLDGQGNIVAQAISSTRGQPAWKRKALRLIVPGVSLSKTIINERRRSR